MCSVRPVFIAIRIYFLQNAEKTSEIRREEERIQWDTLPGRTKRRIEEEEGPQEPTSSDRKIDANSNKTPEIHVKM